MTKQYQYTILRTDGSKEVLPPSPKKSFDGKGGLYELINCRTIQEVPKLYFPKGMSKRAYAWCDEEGLLEGKPQNPHFLEAIDVIFNDKSYIVGDVVLEEVYHGE